MKNNWRKICGRGKMKAAILALNLAVLLCAALFGCSADTGNGTGLPDRNTVPTSEQSAFVRFEKQMSDAGIEYGKEELEETAKSIGAKSGAAYSFAHGSMRVFQFYADSAQYIEIFNSKTVALPEKNGDSVVEYPAIAYRGVVVTVSDFEDAGLVKKLLGFVSDQWYRG
jgi:hypothetical protein